LLNYLARRCRHSIAAGIAGYLGDSTAGPLEQADAWTGRPLRLRQMPPLTFEPR
jgi:hypothetical protein